MTRPALLLLATLVACHAARAAEHAPRMLGDGRIHAEPADGEDAIVHDGPDGRATTLRIPGGVTYHAIVARDASIIELTGGRVTGDISASSHVRLVGRVNLTGGSLTLPARGGAEVMALSDGDALVYAQALDGTPRMLRLAGRGLLVMTDGQSRAFLSAANTGKLVPIPAALTPPAPGRARDLRGFLLRALLVPAVVLVVLLARRNWRRALGPVATVSLALTMTVASLWHRSLHANDFWLGHRGDLVQLCRSTGGAIVWWSSHHATTASNAAWHYGHADRHPSDPTLSRLPRPHWPTAVQEAVVIPYWLLGMLTAIPLALRCVALTRSAFRRRHAPRNACPNCGYDLRSSSGRCPECGAVIAETRG